MKRHSRLLIAVACLAAALAGGSANAAARKAAPPQLKLALSATAARISGKTCGGTACVSGCQASALLAYPADTAATHCVVSVTLTLSGTLLNGRSPVAKAAVSGQLVHVRPATCWPDVALDIAYCDAQNARRANPDRTFTFSGKTDGKGALKTVVTVETYPAAGPVTSTKPTCMAMTFDGAAKSGAAAQDLTGTQVSVCA